jgi:hypothetical protein
MHCVYKSTAHINAQATLIMWYVKWGKKNSRVIYQTQLLNILIECLCDRFHYSWSKQMHYVNVRVCLNINVWLLYTACTANTARDTRIKWDCAEFELYIGVSVMSYATLSYRGVNFDVFLTVRHNIDLFNLPT